MNIQEFLKSQRFEDVFEQLTKTYIGEWDVLEYKNEYPSINDLKDEEILERITAAKRELCQKTWSELTTIECISNSSYVLASAVYKDIDDDGELTTTNDVFLCKIEELEQFDISSVKEVHDYEALQSSGSRDIERYSIIDIDWKELLGYEVAESSFKYIDKVQAAAVFFWEATWFGYTYELNQKNKEKEFLELESRFKKMEENDENCISAEELFQEWDKKMEETMSEKEIRQLRAEVAEYERKAKELTPIISVYNHNQGQKLMVDLYKEFVLNKIKG
jgi:hypothetical protein